MTKLVRYWVIAAVFLLALAIPAAAGIVDLNPNDKNSITEFLEYYPVPPLLVVWEDYKETRLVPYPSHDGFAIVNPQGGYFDTVVTRDAGNYGRLIFHVTNSGPYRWSDYHFEFWNPTFTQPMFPGAGNFSSSIFTNQSYEGDVLSFWAPGWQEIGQRNTFYLTFVDVLTSPLGIRQVATTPVPPAVWLFGSGLLGLAGWRRLKKG